MHAEIRRLTDEAGAYEVLHTYDGETLDSNEIGRTACDEFKAACDAAGEPYLNPPTVRIHTDGDYHDATFQAAFTARAEALDLFPAPPPE